jgi:hypothetical protein
MKKCTKCKAEKPRTEFYNNRTHKSGKTFWCKVCSNHQSNQVGKETKSLWASRTYFNNKHQNPELYLWKQAKHRAKESGLPFDIEISDIDIPQECPYLGCPLLVRDKQLAPSLDRIDSSKGYTKGNIQVISYQANRMKSNATIEDLLAFARGILEVHAKEGQDCAH